MLKIRVDKMVEVERDGEIKAKSIGSFEHIIRGNEDKEIEIAKAILETITKTI